MTLENSSFKLYTILFLRSESQQDKAITKVPSLVKQVRLMALTVSGSTNIFEGRDMGTDESLLSTSTNTRSYFVPPLPFLTKSTPSFTVTVYRSLSWRPNWSLATRTMAGSTSTASMLTFGNLDTI